MKKLIVGLTLMVAASLALGEFAVTGVTAKQRYPWNGLVDITVTLSGPEEECAAATFPFYVTNKTTCAELPIGSVKAVGAVSGSGNTWTRRFIWNATADVGGAKFGEVELTVGAPVTGGVQLWENGPYWAEYNVGASQPEECGYYFWWGDTVGCKRNASNNGWISVKDSAIFSFIGNTSPTDRKNNSQLQSAGYIDATGNLVAAHDAATANLGASWWWSWRMPTDAELGALVSNCDTEWTTRNGVPGRLVKGRGAYASRNIFLPAAGRGYGTEIQALGSSGFYSSSTPYSDDFNARILYFGSGSIFTEYSARYIGRPVRPVRGFVQ